MTIGLYRIAAACFAGAALMASGAAAADEATFALGRKLFLEATEPPCAMCHTLADAGSVGAVGPILDTLKPNKEQVATAVTNGIGAMPPYETLTPEQVDALAVYVSTAAANGK
jgi:cytochrome c6